MNRPIGIFDSGIGGLTVLREALRELPNEEFIYFGDTARVPYGGKSKETITRFSEENIRFLQTFDIKLGVVACHTASSLALKHLNEKFSLPIIGVVEPGTKRALSTTKNGRIGVIGTRATISSGAYESSLKNIDTNCRVYSTACPLFVPFIEEGWVDGDIIWDVVARYLEPLKSFHIDTLILGCTHYPLLADIIGEIMTDNVQLVNPAEETAQEASSLLRRMNLNVSKSKKPNRSKFFVSDEPEHFRQVGEKFLGETIHSVTRVSELTHLTREDIRQKTRH